MNTKIYEFDAMIEAVPKKGGAYIRFSYDCQAKKRHFLRISVPFLRQIVIFMRGAVRIVRSGLLFCP